MHENYGFDDTASDSGEKVTGLHTHFGPKVQVVGIGRWEEHPWHSPDFHVEIAESDIEASEHRDALC
jgi:hypothetical protein